MAALKKFGDTTTTQGNRLMLHVDGYKVVKWSEVALIWIHLNVTVIITINFWIFNNGNNYQFDKWIPLRMCW